MIFLTRKAEFSSAHYYWNDAWSPEENERVFGKCANRNGHGHNYTLEVTVAGEVDPTSGFVVDLKQLKDILEREVVSVYDHRHLNLEVPEFAKAIPTTENIAIAIWNGWRIRFRMRSCIAFGSMRCLICLRTIMVSDEGASDRAGITSAPRIGCIPRRMMQRGTVLSLASATTRMGMGITTPCR